MLLGTCVILCAFHMGLECLEFLEQGLEVVTHQHSPLAVPFLGKDEM